MMHTFFFLIIPGIIVITFFITPKKKSLRRFLTVFQTVAILFLFQSIVRIYWYDMYIVSSNSMERTIFEGDMIIIKKKLKESMERNDVALFRSTWDNNMYLVKRCIGLPGDTLMINQDTVFYNGNLLPFLPNYQWSYFLSDSIPLEKIEAIIKRRAGTHLYENPEDKFLYLTTLETEQVQKLLSINLERATMAREDKPYLYPYIPDIVNNRDNNPLIYVPRKGDNIALTKENIFSYQGLISNENPEIIFNGEDCYLNGTKIVNYIIENDYYYMMGDNRHASQDSRYWGFIPKKNIIGKMVAVIPK